VANFKGTGIGYTISVLCESHSKIHLTDYVIGYTAFVLCERHFIMRLTDYAVKTTPHIRSHLGIKYLVLSADAFKACQWGSEGWQALPDTDLGA